MTAQRFLALIILLTLPNISAMHRTTAHLHTAALANLRRIPTASARLAVHASSPQRPFKRQLSDHVHGLHPERANQITPEKEQKLLDALWVTITDHDQQTEEDSKKRSEAIQQALDAGISTDARLYQENIPLFHLAISDIHSPLALSFIRQGVSIHAQDGKYGFTPLHVACLYGNRAVILELLARRADINARSKVRATPLNCAATYGDPEIIRLLCEAGANFTTKDAKGRTPLHTAIHNIASLQKAHKTPEQLKKLSDALDTITALVKAGVPINEPDEDGDTALHMAADIDYPQCLRRLLTHHANVNITNKRGETPLRHARNKHNNISILLMHGAQVNAPDNEGFTPLHAAAAHGDEACVLTLINGKANVHAVNEIGATPLHCAAYVHNNKTVEALRNNGASIDAKTKNGSTPFQAAILGSDTLRTLICAGATPPDADWWTDLVYRMLTASETVDTV